MSIALAVVGDFKPDNPSHIATNDSIQHCSAAAGLDIIPRWIGTPQLANPGDTSLLDGFNGFWIAPASPYRRMEGALNAIRAARENKTPLLGTCGGFQHIVIEYARNVLGIADAEHEESEPGASRFIISRLACSLVGRTMSISLKAGSRVARAYGQTTAREEYHCNFGVNPEYVETLRSSELDIVGSDEEGTIRAVELPAHPFFVGTLFLPQHNSTAAAPHPLISAFLKACAAATAFKSRHRSATKAALNL